MAFPIFDTKDAIPKGFESDYEEKEGKWHPRGDDGLKSALNEERTKREAAERLVNKAAADRAELERKLLAASGDDKDKDKLAKALQKFDSDLAAEKEKFQKELDRTAGELRTLKLDDKVKAAFLKAGGRPERADKALNDTKALFDLATDGRIIVKDAKGEATTGTVEDFFGKTYKAEMAEFYTGTKAAGGGAGGGAGKGVQSSGKMSADDLLANPLKALQAANAEAA